MPIFLLSKLAICRLHLYLNRLWMLSAIYISNLLYCTAHQSRCLGHAWKEAFGLTSPCLSWCLMSSLPFRQNWGRGLGPGFKKIKNHPITFIFSQGRKTKECDEDGKEPTEKGKVGLLDLWKLLTWLAGPMNSGCSCLRARAQEEQEKVTSVLGRQNHLSN